MDGRNRPFDDRRVLSSRVLPCSNSRGGGESGARREIHPCGNIAREHTWPRLQLQPQPPRHRHGDEKGEGKTSAPAEGRYGASRVPHWPARRGRLVWMDAEISVTQRSLANDFQASNEPVKMNNCFSSFFLFLIPYRFR